MRRPTSTILPPPSDYPVPMPEVAEVTPDSGAWRALVEVTKDTVRPGALHAFLKMNDHSYFSIVQMPDLEKIPS